jgi:hypothetical protein
MRSGQSCATRQKQQIGLHPTSHLVLHEQDGYQQLWGLKGQLLGDAEVVLPLPRARINHQCMCEISVGRRTMQQPPAFWQNHLSACLSY